MHAIDLSGQRFGRLIAVEATRLRQWRAWSCRCDCGAMIIVKTGDLRSGNTRSCGCLHDDIRRQLARRYLGKGNARHWLYYTPEHGVWATMKSRCFNPNAQRYADYGGRGIEVCERWLDFVNFYADMGPRPDGRSPGGRALFSLERIDNDGHYEPGNCRWATTGEQRVNRRARQ